MTAPNLAAPVPPWLGGALVAGGVLVAVGSALPWITLTGPGAAAATVFIHSKGGGLGGLDHEGAVTVVLAVAAAWLGVAHRLGRARWLAPWGGLAAGVATLALVALAAADTSSLADPFGGPAKGVVQGRGVGVWVTAAGGAVLVAAALVALAVLARRVQPSSSSTSSTDSRIPVMASTTDGNRATAE
ncbi:MAG: hypothetical protein KF703_15895 [Actinobacteria bacterium]|nr:hypothetical protein [Actinomycetota bacterium]